MEEYEENDALTEHIWSSLFQGKEEDTKNTVAQADSENTTIPPVHMDWLNPTELETRRGNQVSEEVNRRVREEQNLTIQDNNTMNKNWERHVVPTDLVPKVQDTHVSDERVSSDSENESDSEGPPLTLRRHRKVTSRGNRQQPSWKAKTGINYRGMFALFRKQANISDAITSTIIESDCAHLRSLDLNGQDFSSTPATRSLQRRSYLSIDSTYEDMHPLVYIAKIQAHDTDNPNYSDVLRCEDEERKLWEAAMITELKSLRDLGSFKMVSRPRGTNILQSTWAYRKRRYPDGQLKK